MIYLAYKTPLTIAIDKGNADIVNLLLNHQNIDVNLKLVSFNYCL